MAENEGPMRVTAIDTLNATRLHERGDQWITAIYRSIKADACIVRITGEDGVVGYGEASSYGNPVHIADWVQWLGQELIGADIDDPAIVPAPHGTGDPSGRGSSAHDFAVAGLDCALWDLRGKAAGVPVRELLASESDGSCEVYASTGVRYDWRGDPDALIDDVVESAAAGYTTVKVRLGTHWQWDAVTPARFLELYDRVLERVGPAVSLAVDANARLTLAEALELGTGLAERECAWFEEPIPIRDIDGYALLNRELGVPVTGGESWTTAEQFRPFLDTGGYAMVQADAGLSGISELMRIGRLAARYDVGLLPHSWHNGLMARANAHAVAASPNGRMLEECMVQGPLKWGILENGNPVHDGVMTLDAPGLGDAVITDLVERYPYIEGHYAVEVFR